MSSTSSEEISPIPPITPKESKKILFNLIKQTYGDILKAKEVQGNKVLREIREFYRNHTAPLIKFNSEEYCDDSKEEEEESSSSSSVEDDEAKALPPMKPYVQVKQNIRVKDQRLLKYVPYLGEDADYNELFCNYEGASNASNKTVSDHLDDVEFVNLVKNVDSSGDYSIEVFKAISETLPMNMSARQLKKKFKALVKPPKKCFPSIDSVDAESLSRQNTLSSYQAKFCRRCYVYGCLTHKEPSRFVENPHLIFPEKVKVKETPCGEHCYMQMQVDEEEDNAYELANVWTGSDESLFRLLHHSFSANYCVIARHLHSKTCRQVYEFSQNSEEKKKLDEDFMTQKRALFSSQAPKKATVNKSHVEKTDEEVAYFVPCHCEGKCMLDCLCFSNKNFCEKFCNCSSLQCSNRFPGCKCKAQCVTAQCPCFLALRECDPDVCKCKINLKGEKTCKNVVIQRRMKKHLLLAKSDVAGWGIFTRDDIEKDEFVSEYCGELISKEEGERRGKIYDTLGTSYLFNLSKEYEIDATRKGNKIRFCNHSDTPNCYAKTVYVLGDTKIGIFAMKKIKAGDELFFDYRYGPSEKLKFVNK